MNGDVNLDNYYTKSECDNKYALKSHSHSISNITNLQSQLNSKAASNHTHSQYATTSAVTNAQNTANNALNVANSKATLDINNSSHSIAYNSSVASYTPPKNCCNSLISRYANGKLYQRGILVSTQSKTYVPLLAAGYPVTADDGNLYGNVYFI